MLSATRVLVLLALGYTVATSSVSAQTRRSLRFGFGLGAAAPQGDFKEDPTGEGFDPGWHAIGYLEFAPSRTPFGLRMEVTFTRNPANQQLKDDIEAELGPGFDASMRTVGGNASATWTIPLTPRTKGYLIGGVGFATPALTISSGSVSADTSQTNFAWNAGAGLTFPLTPVTMFVEFRYYRIATTFEFASLPFVAVTAGIRLGR